MILMALEEALSFMQTIVANEGSPLPGEYWHVTEHYENIRAKVAADPLSEKTFYKCKAAFKEEDLGFDDDVLRMIYTICRDWRQGANRPPPTTMWHLA